MEWVACRATPISPAERSGEDVSGYPDSGRCSTLLGRRITCEVADAGAGGRPMDKRFQAAQAPHAASGGDRTPWIGSEAGTGCCGSSGSTSTSSACGRYASGSAADGFSLGSQQYREAAKERRKKASSHVDRAFPPRGSPALALTCNRCLSGRPWLLGGTCPATPFARPVDGLARLLCVWRRSCPDGVNYLCKR